MNENMENVVMETESEMTTEAAGNSLGGKIVGGLLIGGAIVGVGTLARKAYKKIKAKIQSKKAAKATDVEVDEYEEVDCEEA